MRETYFKWMDKNSKDMGIICEAITVSAPEQKIKVMELSNADNSYNYTDMNYRFRPLFNNRIITISSYFKFNDVDERAKKLTEITNWLFSWTSYLGNHDLQILPDYDGVIWTNATIESFQQIDVVSMHTVKLIFQFRVDCFSSEQERYKVSLGSFNFSNGISGASSEVYLPSARNVHAWGGGSYPPITPITPIPGGKTLRISFNNIGFFTNDFVIKFTGQCNWIELYNFNDNKNNEIQIADGFEFSCYINFFEKRVGVENTGPDGKPMFTTYYPDTDYYELKPGNNEILVRSDGNFSAIDFIISPKYLYGKVNQDDVCTASAEFITST